MGENNLIVKITDEDLGLSSVKIENPRLRYGARGIVIREDGKIALFHKAKRNEYKLPGGGVEDGESPEQAFRREVLEETGYKIEIVRKLGITEECKTRDNFRQISYVFVGKAIGDTKGLNLTKEEQNEGGEMSWEIPEKALELISDSYNQLTTSDDVGLYHERFIVLRDKAILKYYLEAK